MTKEIFIDMYSDPTLKRLLTEIRSVRLDAKVLALDTELQDDALQDEHQYFTVVAHGLDTAKYATDFHRVELDRSERKIIFSNPGGTAEIIPFVEGFEEYLSSKYAEVDKNREAYEAADKALMSIHSDLWDQIYQRVRELGYQEQKKEDKLTILGRFITNREKPKMELPEGLTNLISDLEGKGVKVHVLAGANIDGVQGEATEETLQ